MESEQNYSNGSIKEFLSGRGVRRESEIREMQACRKTEIEIREMVNQGVEKGGTEKRRKGDGIVGEKKIRKSMRDRQINRITGKWKKKGI
jgi:hypothetical protein